MNKGAFTDFVEDLALHFGQDKFVEPNPQTKKRIESWFNQVKQLPDESLYWMAGQIKRNNEFFPRNLSKTILELWPGWRNQHPEKCAPAHAKSKECHDCIDGLLYAYTWHKNQILTAAFRCLCGRAYRDFPAMPIASKSELESNGWIIVHVMPSGKHVNKGGMDFSAVV